MTAAPKPQAVTAADAAVLYRLASLAVRATAATAAQRDILAIIMGAFPADSGSLALLSAESGQLEISVQHGLPTDAGKFALRPGQGITGWVALHAKPLLVPDVAAEIRYIAARPGVRCEMAAPLIAEGRTIGVINLDADRRAAFDESALARLQHFAEEAGAVLHRLWQLERLRSNATQLTTLVELGHSLVTQLAPEELLTALTQSGRSLFNARLCLLHDYDPARRELHLHAWAATGDLDAARLTLPPATVSADLALLTAVIRSGKVMEFQNIDGPGYSEAGDLPRDRTLCSALAAPLMLDGLPTGVLTIFYDQAHRFNDDEKRLATALASFAAVALQNARLYARIFHTEEVLRKNETLTTLGLLAAEIAHEIRNPLTVIKLLHGTLGLDFNPADPRRRDLEVITDKITQLETIVTRVLSFGRASETLHARWALSEILDDTLVLLRAKLAQANIQWHCAHPDRALYLNGNKGQLQQVLLNLVLNAVQAMPHGGHLTLRHSVAGLRLQLEITDTGSGIPAAIQPRIFESFLSGRVDGTGLGLAIAQRIMKDHQGELTLAATGSQGTTMRLILPLLPA